MIQVARPLVHCAVSPELGSPVRARRIRLDTPTLGRTRASSGLSLHPRVPAGTSNLRPRQIPPHLVLPGRVAPQHLAPDRHFEGPVGQLRLRRLLLPPPAAHPPVAPPGLGLGRAGRAKRSRRSGVAGHGARGSSDRLSTVARRRAAVARTQPKRPAQLARPNPRCREGRSNEARASSCRRARAANRQPLSRSSEKSSCRLSASALRRAEVTVSFRPARGKVRGKGQSWRRGGHGREEALCRQERRMRRKRRLDRSVADRHSLSAGQDAILPFPRCPF